MDMKRYKICALILAISLAQTFSQDNNSLVFHTNSCSCYCLEDPDVDSSQVGDDSKLKSLYIEAGCRCYCLKAPGIDLHNEGGAPQMEGSGEADMSNNIPVYQTDAVMSLQTDNLEELTNSVDLNVIIDDPDSMKPIDVAASLSGAGDIDDLNSSIKPSLPLKHKGTTATETELPQKDAHFVQESCDTVKCMPGPTGTAGVKGEAGPRGRPGLQGNSGHPGARGPEGPQGSRGLRGPQGKRGEEGPRGLDGPRGGPGLRGLQGPAGFIGRKGEPGITTTVQNVQKAAFQVRLKDHMGPYTVKHNVVFETIEINVGDVYRAENGAFVAPYNGTYAFHLNLMVYGPNMAWASIDMNGMPMSYAWVGSSGSHYEATGSTMLLLQLGRGDVVNVVLQPIDNPPNYLYGHHTSFAGFLLYSNET